jgi:cytochrome c556
MKNGRETMIRTVIAIAAVALGVSAVVAQSDPIAARKAVMKGIGDQTKVGAAMAKGEAPFDLAKAKVIFAAYVEAASKLPSLFPENSKTGGETAAAPKIWENTPDFTAKLAKLSSDAKAADGLVKDLDTFKTNFGEITKSCGGCHETYRLKKS